jgi:hypothetical protein
MTELDLDQVLILFSEEIHHCLGLPGSRLQQGKLSMHFLSNVYIIITGVTALHLYYVLAEFVKDIVT